MEQNGNSQRSGKDAEEGNQSATPIDVKLTGIDLNLLVVLEALLITRNVTHAARRIGQSQPAVSRALSRLRDVLGDDLLVRSSVGMKLTARGEQLGEIVPAAMLHVRNVIASRQTENAIRLSINANLTPVLLPHFLRQSAVRENEPVKVSTHKSADEGMTQLRLRTADYVLGTLKETSPAVETETIFGEQFVTLVAFERHRLGGIRPSEAAFLGLIHINLVENGTEIFPQVAETLMAHGVRRSRLFEVPDLTSAALMVSESQLALTVPRSIASWLTKTMLLSAILPPVAIPEHQVSIHWLSGASGPSRRRLVDDIGTAARQAIAQDQASARALRTVSEIE
jgi:DNA-binding transcriptional LysR family regulator